MLTCPRCSSFFSFWKSAWLLRIARISSSVFQNNYVFFLKFTIPNCISQPWLFTTWFGISLFSPYSKYSHAWIRLILDVITSFLGKFQIIIPTPLVFGQSTVVPGLPQNVVSTSFAWKYIPHDIYNYFSVCWVGGLSRSFGQEVGAFWEFKIPIAHENLPLYSTTSGLLWPSV